MPYNTRRKSLSLPALGIQLPNTSRAHRPSLSKSSISSEAQAPPTKRLKRSHTSTTPSPAVSARPRSSTTSSSSSKSVSFAEPPKHIGRTAYEHTPPPSPGAETASKIDPDDINDDIVTAVISQLEKTGNRPHLIKELSAILSTTISAVASSANPSALLSSRLTAYIRRPTFTPHTPCPLAKDLLPTHPRKAYYHLTTHPPQPFTHPPHRILITPSASIDSDDPTSSSSRSRAQLSPSPEIDLSAPADDDQDPDLLHDNPAAHDPDADFPTPMTPAASAFGAGPATAESHPRPLHAGAAGRFRGASPPLEGDEREFTATAWGLRMRGVGVGEGEGKREDGGGVVEGEEKERVVREESEDEKARRNSEVAVALFGPSSERSREQSLVDGEGASAEGVGSPVLGRVVVVVGGKGVEGGEAMRGELVGNDQMDVDVDVDVDVATAGGDSILGEAGIGYGAFGEGWRRGPECVGMEELDELLGGF